MGKVTQVNNNDSGLTARTNYNEAMKTVESDSSLSGSGTTGDPLKVESVGYFDNISATTAPAITNDSSENYEVGSTWIDVANDNVYKCVDATVGAAVWEWLNEPGGGGEYDFSFAISDEISDLTTDNDGEINAIRAQTIQSITFAVNVAPTGSPILVDILKNGSTILTTPISLPAATKIVTITIPQISNTSIAVDDVIKADITQIGATVSGAGAKVYFKTILV